MKRFISLGAGVQSSTMALMAAHGEITPMPDGAIFADTQAEPKAVYEWLDWLEPRLPFPVRRVTAGSLRKNMLWLREAKHGGRYFEARVPFLMVEPGGKVTMNGRHCTTDYKLVPLVRRVREAVGTAALRGWRKHYAAELREVAAYRAYEKEKKRAKKTGIQGPPYRPFPHKAWDEMQAHPLAVQWIGISLDETQRMKPSGDPWITCRWPLVERRITREACLEWMSDHGYPRPPRSACVFCPFHGNAEWKRLKDEEPEAFADAVAVDEELRRKAPESVLRGIPYLHRSLVPLAEADLRSDVDRGQLLLWQDECTGMCGV